jgi:hypothetical protein
VQLEQAAGTALRLRRPTVLKVEWVMQLIQACPDLFFYEPRWRASTAVHASQVGSWVHTYALQGFFFGYRSKMVAKWGQIVGYRRFAYMPGSQIW